MSIKYCSPLKQVWTMIPGFNSPYTWYNHYKTDK